VYFWARFSFLGSVSLDQNQTQPNSFEIKVNIFYVWYNRCQTKLNQASLKLDSIEQSSSSLFYVSLWFVIIHVNIYVTLLAHAVWLQFEKLAASQKLLLYFSEATSYLYIKTR
jgi:hypothetical protein